MKLTSGMKSSEFWVTIVATVVLALWPDMPKESLLPVLGYVVSRGLAKWGNSPGTL